MQTCSSPLSARAHGVQWVLILAAILCCGPAFGQSITNDSGDKLSSPEASGPKTVSLYLSARAKKGQTLENLKASELVVNDAGQTVDPREIHVSLDVAGGDRLVTFIFDRLGPGNSRSAGVIANRILKEIAGHAGGIGIWAVDSRMRVVQTYTLDRGLLDGAIKTATAGPIAATPATEVKAGSPEPAPQAPKERAWSTASRASLVIAERAVTERHAPWGLAALMAAAESQRAMPGRKAIVYFTEESPSDMQALDMFHTVSQQLRDAGISLFAIDMNAVDQSTSNGMQAAIAMGGQATSNRAAVLAADPRAPLGKTLGLQPLNFKAMTDTITSIEFDSMDGNNKNFLADTARLSGGLYTNAGSDTRKISRELIGDLASFYTLTYPVPDSRRDGKFHPVLVKTARAGVRTEAHLGYFAAMAGSGSSEGRLGLRARNSGEGSDLERLANNASGSGLTLHAAVLRFGKSAAGLHSVIALEVPAGDLDLHEDDNTDLYSLHASVAAEIRDAGGAPVARFHEEFHRRGAVDTEESMRGQTLSVTRSVSLEPGDYTLESIVRDWNTGKTGRNVQKIQLSDKDDAEAVSDVVLVRATEEKGNNTGPGALQYGPMRVVPNLSGELRGKVKSAALYFQTYEGSEEPGKRVLRVEVSKDGKLIDTVPLHTSAHSKEGSAQVATVPLKAGAGAYTLALSIEQAGQTIRREVSLTVADSPAEVAHVEESAKPEESASALMESGLTTLAGTTLSEQDSAALIESARNRALAYATSLPNFLCVEKIDRSADRKGTGVWKHRDNIVELLRYQDKTENRTVLEVNGEKSSIPAERLEGARSNGEFGAILKTVFAPTAGAEFHWQKTEEQNGVPLQVYSFTVAAKNSQFYVTDRSGSQLRSAFHGVVTVDGNTLSVRRLMAQTDELPASFGVKSSWMAVEYDYIAINNHDYLLPTRGEVGLTQGKRETVLNQLRFSEYRRFGARSRIIEGAALQR